MGWGLLTEEDQVAIAPHVRGKIVEDLGSGDREVARRLVKIGAASVIAVNDPGLHPGLASLGGFRAD